MKGKLGKIPVIFILAMFLMSFVAVFPVSAVPADIWMAPSTNPPPPGPYISFTWEITIWVDTQGAPLFAYQVMVDLSCLDDYVEVVSARNNKGDGSWVFQGKATVGTIPVIIDKDLDGNPDGALLGDSILTGTAFTGVGTLGVLELHIKAGPSKGETIDCIMDIVEGADTFLLDDGLFDIPYSAIDGTFYWEYEYPTTHPHAAVHNPGPPRSPLDGYCTTDFLAGGDTIWNCTDFDVDVYISTLDPMWGLTTATINLQFDPTLLDIIGGLNNITMNPIWPISTKNIVGDTIELYVEWPCGIDPGEIDPSYPKPNSVLVATIRFHIFDQKTIPPEAPGYQDEVDLVFT